MSDLTDLTPLESLHLPGLGSIDCSGLILIVGPNSSGKSQLLRDIHLRISGELRPLVVAEEVGIRQLPQEALLEALQSAGFIRVYEDDSGTPHLRPLTTYAGSGQHAGAIPVVQAEKWHQTHRPASREGRTRDEYLWYFGRFLVTALFLDQRLTALNQVGLIDFVDQPPQCDLHALYMSDNARARLLGEVRSSFGKGVWPDISRGNGICLRVSDEPGIPSDADRLSPRKMDAFRTIETEGDGLKSYVATCVALLLGRRPVCIVDEPEMCLHPPQAYTLGRFIGEFGSSSEAVTFVATHSSHTLRGVIRTARKLQIIRLTRLGGSFQAHVVAAEAVEEALTKPAVRAESVLDGIFAEGVVIVEADGDRTVYQAVRESLDAEFRLNAHFAAVGGTGGIADTCALYVTLRIPVAVIADMDIVADENRLLSVLDAIGCGTSRSLVTEAMRIIALVRELPPTITEEEARSSILAALPDEMDWDDGHDTALRTTLGQVAGRLNRMARLKASASDRLPDDIRLPLAALLEQLRAEGLFVVPVGELEEWLAGHEIAVSKRKKWAWANEAASLIGRTTPPPGNDIWEFMRQVFGYLQNRLADLATNGRSRHDETTPDAATDYGSPSDEVRNG